jgi:hypothetical protein
MEGGGGRGPSMLFKGGFFGFFLFVYVNQHCSICRPSDSAVPEDAGIASRISTAWHQDALTTRLDLIHRTIHLSDYQNPKHAIPQSTHRVEIATFWRTFHHDGKLAQPGEGAWGFTPTPFHYIYHHVYTVVVLYVSAERAGTFPYFNSTPTCTLCAAP